MRSRSSSSGISSPSSRAAALSRLIPSSSSSSSPPPPSSPSPSHSSPNYPSSPLSSNKYKPPPPSSTSLSPSSRNNKFNVEQFKSADYSTSQFIDNLTKNLVEDQVVNGGEFNAVAFKTLLDDNLDFLQEFGKEMDDDIQSLVEQCNASDKSFKMQIADLAHNYENNFAKFAKLDARINRVGSSAARIGDRLEAVDLQQKRADDAASCIKYFMELNNNDSKRSAIFTDPNKVHELAHLIKKLSGVAQELDLQSLNRGKMATEIISNNIENELLISFEKAAEAKDYDTMKEFAHTLVEFNGGDSCIQRYIITLDMFFDLKSLAKDEATACDTSLRRVTPDLLIDTRLDQFYADIIKAVEREDEIIARVFPSPPIVMSQLLQRIFEQRVRAFMELMFKIDEEDELLYLRTLCLALDKTRNILVQGLKKYTSFGVDFGTHINSVFCNYQNEYIDRELRYLISLFNRNLESISNAMAEPEIQGTLDQSHREKDREAIIGLVNTFVSATEDAVTRAKVMSGENELPRNVQKLFNCLLNKLGKDFLIDLINRACRLASPVNDQQLTAAVAANKFLLALQNFFTLVQTTTLGVLLIQRHFQNTILPYVSSSVNEYTQCYEVLGALMSALENKLSSGMNIAMNSLFMSVEKILGEQKKDDFKFKEESYGGYSNDPTKVCQVCVKFIRNVYDTLIDTLDGRNVEIFLEEFGLGIQKSLLNHFKKFKISKGLGGLTLMRDLAEYKDALKTFQIPSVDEACEILGEISKIHLVAPENLKTVIEEGILSRMDKNEVLTYIRLRSDYKSTWTGKYI